jgi:hypothetical protein
MEHDLVICQAKVTMEEVVQYTLQYQKVANVVAEFHKITVGGASGFGWTDNSLRADCAFMRHC